MRHWLLPEAIEDLLPGTGARALYGEAFPETMNTQRHQVVHQIIFGGYRVKYISDQRFFLVTVDTLETKVGLIVHSRTRLQRQWKGVYPIFCEGCTRSG